MVLKSLKRAFLEKCIDLHAKLQMLQENEFSFYYIYNIGYYKTIQS